MRQAAFSRTSVCSWQRIQCRCGDSGCVPSWLSPGCGRALRQLQLSRGRSQPTCRAALSIRRCRSFHLAARPSGSSRSVMTELMSHQCTHRGRSHHEGHDLARWEEGFEPAADRARDAGLEEGTTGARREPPLPLRSRRSSGAGRCHHCCWTASPSASSTATGSTVRCGSPRDLR